MIGKTESFSLTAGKDGEVLVKTDTAIPKANKQLKPVSKVDAFTTDQVKMRKGEILQVKVA